MNKISKNQKGFTAVEGLLIILTLAVIGFGGYYVYHTNHKAKTASVSTSGANNSASGSTKSTAANPYAGWNSYTDVSKLFSVMYPSGWTAANPQEHADTPFTLADPNVIIFTAVNTSNTSPIEVDVLAFSTSDVQSVLSKDSYGEQQSTPQSMTINGYQALYGQDIETGANGTNPTYTDDQYAVAHNGVTLSFSFREKQGNDENVGAANASGAFDHTSIVPDFNLIAKSVKFLN
jgi:hypothetical protein